MPEILVDPKYYRRQHSGKRHSAMAAMGSFGDLEDAVEEVYASLNAHRAQAVLNPSEESDDEDDADAAAPMHIFNAPCFSQHWEVLGQNLTAPKARGKLRDHLKETQEAAEIERAAPASSPRLVADTDADSAPSTARSTAAESTIETIKAAHAARSAQVSPRADNEAPSSSSSVSPSPRPTVPNLSSPVEVKPATHVAKEASKAVEVKKSAQGEEEEEGEPLQPRTRGATGKNDQFGKQEYWDGRFEQEEQYDWLLTFDQVASQLLPLLVPYGKTASILMVGCGNSTFSADLYDAGFENITNLDYSGVVISRMRSLHAAVRPRMTWLEGDMTQLGVSFPLQPKFDVVIDKAALDALMVDERSVWSPAEGVVAAADATCQGVKALLRGESIDAGGSVALPAPVLVPAASGKPPSMEALVAAALAAEAAQAAAAAAAKLPGLYVMISFMQPHFRTKYLSGKHADDLEGLRDDLHSATAAATAAKGYVPRYDWHLRHENIALADGSFNHFLYVMYRGHHDLLLDNSKASV